MRRLFWFSIAAPLLLAACAIPGGVLDNNGTVISNAAGATTLDEKAGIDATNAYTAASTLGKILAQNGLIDKVAFKCYDNVGYAATLSIHTAYLSTNSTNYLAAISKAWGAVGQIKALADPLTKGGCPK